VSWLVCELTVRNFTGRELSATWPVTLIASLFSGEAVIWISARLHLDLRNEKRKEVKKEVGRGWKHGRNRRDRVFPLTPHYTDLRYSAGLVGLTGWDLTALTAQIGCRVPLKVCCSYKKVQFMRKLTMLRVGINKMKPLQEITPQSGRL